MSQFRPSTMQTLLETGKLINDPIHGHIRLNQTCVKIIDTPEFQRLRDLKQLGSSYFVFPGGSHCRFEHSVGTCHLAGSLVERLKSIQPELDITNHDVDLVKVAGLCHDLGHGPFSHVFDNEVIPRLRPDSTWKHEDASLMMFEHLVNSNGLDWDTEDIRTVQSLIKGRRPESGEKLFLYDVVANYRNSIDVDKFDYMARDCYNLGMKSSYDFSRLMNFCKVIDDEICFQAKEVFTIYEMFHTRYSLFKQVYSHKVAKAIEFMITDAMILADPVMKFSEAIDDPCLYAQLTDCVIRNIEFSADPRLAASRKIIRDIRTRNIYKCADEIVLTERDAQMLKGQLTAENIVKFVPNDREGELRLEEVIVDSYALNYAMKDKNPVDGVRFFNSWSSDESFPIPKEKVSYLMPGSFSERHVRIFCKDPQKVDLCREAFRALLRYHRCVSPLPSAKAYRGLSQASFGGHLPDVAVFPSAEPANFGESEDELFSPAKKVKVDENESS